MSNKVDHKRLQIFLGLGIREARLRAHVGCNHDIHMRCSQKMNRRSTKQSLVVGQLRLNLWGRSSNGHHRFECQNYNHNRFSSLCQQWLSFEMPTLPRIGRPLRCRTHSRHHSLICYDNPRKCPIKEPNKITCIGTPCRSSYTLCNRPVSVYHYPQYSSSSVYLVGWDNSHVAGTRDAGIFATWYYDSSHSQTGSTAQNHHYIYGTNSHFVGGGLIPSPYCYTGIFSDYHAPTPTIYDVSGSPLFSHNHHFYFAEFIISGSSSSEGTPARTGIFNQYLTAVYHIFTDTGSQADYHHIDMIIAYLVGCHFSERQNQGYFIVSMTITMLFIRMVLPHRTIICKPGITLCQVQMSSELLAVNLHGNGTMHQQDFIANILSIASSVYAQRLIQIIAHQLILQVLCSDIIHQTENRNSSSEEYYSPIRQYGGYWTYETISSVSYSTGPNNKSYGLFVDRDEYRAFTNNSRAAKGSLTEPIIHVPKSMGRIISSSEVPIIPAPIITIITRTFRPTTGYLSSMRLT